MDEAAILNAVSTISNEAIIATDRDGVITRWNRAAERLYGHSAREIVGHSYTLLVPPDHQNEYRATLARVLEGEPAISLEGIRIRRDGVRILVSQTLAPVCLADAAVTGVISIDEDETGRSLGERDSRRLAAIVESSDDAIVSKDLNGVVTSWNPAATRMFGYAAAEMIGESIRKIIPADRQAEEDTVLSRIRSGERVDHFETIRQRKDGRLIPISLTVSPIRDAAGRIVGASKIARDVSEAMRLRDLAERQAGIASRLSRVGADIASTLDRDAIMQKVTDAATALTEAESGAFFFNDADAQSRNAYSFCSRSGVAKEAFADFLKPRVTAMFAPGSRGGEVVRLDDVTADPRLENNPRQQGDPDGHLPVRSYLAVPVASSSGEVLGGLFFGHSRPGVFTIEHETLATGIAGWASLALQNAHLYVDAREANRTKDEFLAVLSHELRTPLNSILGYARLLRSGILQGSKAQRGMETLERNTTLLTQIVEDVLDVSRIVAGKIRLDVQPVELPVVVHNAIATVSPAADAKGVRIQTTIDPNVGPVSGDPDRLQQVVWNLLSNAVKFTPREGRVQIRLEAVNSHVEIVVSDTGAGIRADFLPFVFERFRQADATTTRKVGGLGLGLAIVRHIVEMHGGTVHASSAGEGLGSTFRVCLPVMIVHPEALEGVREHPRHQVSAALMDLADLHGIRVLAIDDEEDALGLLRVVLEAAGADAVIVPSAALGLEQLEAGAFDALIADLGMPEMDGFELIKRVRASSNAQVRAMPAAALTAFARSDDRTKALRCGFEMHLAKPVDPGELVAAVATLVRRSRGVTSTS